MQVDELSRRLKGIEEASRKGQPYVDKCKAFAKYTELTL